MCNVVSTFRCSMFYNAWNNEKCKQKLADIILEYRECSTSYNDKSQYQWIGLYELVAHSDLTISSCAEINIRYSQMMVIVSVTIY